MGSYMISKEKFTKGEAAIGLPDESSVSRHSAYEFQNEPKSRNLAPQTLESQTSELTVSSELTNLNKSYSFAAQIDKEDFAEIQKLRKIELMKMPFHLRVAEQAKELLEVILAFFTGKRTKGKHMTPTAKKAIIQLRQIAALYSAMPQRSLEETIVFDAAFGKAYYDILYASYKSSSKSREEDSERANYQKAIDGFIETLG